MPFDDEATVFRADDEGGNRTLVPVCRNSITMRLISLRSCSFIIEHLLRVDQCVNKASETWPQAEYSTGILQLDGPRGLLAHKVASSSRWCQQRYCKAKSKASHRRELLWEPSTGYWDVRCEPRLTTITIVLAQFRTAFLIC